MGEYRRAEDGLPVGTLVVERYEWENPAAIHGAKKGVQWLAQIVDKDGDLALMKTCRTRKEAIEVLKGAPTWK